MEISDIKNQVKAYPVSFGAGFLSLLLGAYLYFTLGSLSDLEIQRDDLEHELRILKSNFDEGSTIEADLETLKEKFVGVDAMLVDSDQIADNNDYFYRLGEQLPIDITSVSQRNVILQNANPAEGEIWTLKNYSVVPVEMEIVGLLNDMLDFLYELDQCERFTKVREFELVISNDREPGYMKMELNLNVLGHPQT